MVDATGGETSEGEVEMEMEGAALSSGVRRGGVGVGCVVRGASDSTAEEAGGARELLAMLDGTRVGVGVTVVVE